jgi:hypothetical protein
VPPPLAAVKFTGDAVSQKGPAALIVASGGGVTTIFVRFTLQPFVSSINTEYVPAFKPDGSSMVFTMGVGPVHVYV